MAAAARREAQGIATLSGKDRLQFSFRDSEGDGGNGTIMRSTDGVVVSLKATKMTKQDCIKFYRDGIHLKRLKKPGFQLAPWRDFKVASGDTQAGSLRGKLLFKKRDIRDSRISRHRVSQLLCP